MATTKATPQLFETPIVVNPDCFLQQRRRTSRARLMRRSNVIPTCNACMYGRHRKCIGCCCPCDGEFRAKGIA
jgi:hypothetical protein